MDEGPWLPEGVSYAEQGQSYSRWRHVPAPPESGESLAFWLLSPEEMDFQPYAYRDHFGPEAHVVPAGAVSRDPAAGSTHEAPGGPAAAGQASSSSSWWAPWVDDSAQAGGSSSQPPLAMDDNPQGGGDARDPPPPTKQGGGFPRQLSTPELARQLLIEADQWRGWEEWHPPRSPFVVGLAGGGLAGLVAGAVWLELNFCSH